MSKHNSKPAKAQDPASEGNVDKIRDILFGGQMRDYERRFRQLEERQAKELERYNEALEQRINGLESFVRKELDKLAARNLQEKNERKQALKSLEEAASQMERNLHQELSRQEEEHGREAMDIRNQIHELGKTQTDNLLKAQREINEALERESGQLYDEKVSREELSGFFKEVALRITRELDLPAIDP